MFTVILWANIISTFRILIILALGVILGFLTTIGFYKLFMLAKGML